MLWGVFVIVKFHIEKQKDGLFLPMYTNKITKAPASAGFTKRLNWSALFNKQSAQLIFKEESAQLISVKLYNNGL